MEIAVYHFADGSIKVFIDGKAQKEPEKHIDAERFTIDVYRAKSKPPVERVVCEGPIRACCQPHLKMYEKSANRTWFFRPPLKRPVFMPWYSCHP